MSSQSGSQSICGECGAATYADTLDGLCTACVGRGLWQAEFSASAPAAAESAGPRPGPTHPTAADPFALPAGTRIGPYQLVRPVGEGGFGIVYLAHQLEPIKRPVALKVIKLGMDTRQVVARFEAERQALAMMNHPGIAKVFDAGTTETGRPYFVMEFVQGSPITDYADRQQRTLSERLELFIAVCDAVQHAHQKGVLHRDLKPSNILVAMRGGQPLPTVIDFGLAKATQVELTDKTLVTDFQQLVGTPAYMSPEQMEMGAVDVDTRSDIYALGVLLYELLAGRTPFENAELLRGGMDQVSRRIREEEPPRPSARLHSLRASQMAAIARNRRATPEKLLRQVRGDLDWIVMKALEKNRTRRYETANALALDVRRHLGSEPVRARPPTMLYQFQKLVRRNCVAVAAAATVTLALIAGLGISTVAFVKERGARHDATAKAEESRQRLVRLNVGTGNKLVDEGDYFNALLWFIEALKLDADDPARADIHRRRIGTVLRSSPRLAQIWFHDGHVRWAELSPDGQRVLSAGWDHTARLWNARTGEPLLPPLTHDTIVEGALFTRDGQRIITIDQRGHARLWDVETGRRIGPVLPTAALWAALDVSPDGGRILAGVTNGVQLFDAASGAAIGPAILLTNLVQVLQFSPDGQKALVGGAVNDALLLDMPPAGSQLKLAHTAGLRGAAFSPDGRRVATISLRELRVWDTTTGELIMPATQPGGDLFECQFSPDSRRLAIASWKGFARMFDATTGLPLGMPMRHRNSVTHSIFSADGRWLATASRDGTARVWNPETGEPLSPSLPHSGYAYSVSFSPDGSRLVTSSQDWTVRLWQLRTNRAARLVLRHHAGVIKTHFSPDGTRLLTASFDGQVQIWEARSGALLATLTHPSGVLDACFSAGGDRVVSGTQDGFARVWDLRHAPEISAVARQDGPIDAVAFHPDGESFLTTGADHRGRIWSSLGGRALTAWMTNSKAIRHSAFAPDGHRLVTAGADGVAQLWDAETGAAVGPAMQHACSVRCVAFSADSRRLVTACGDGAEQSRYAQIWNATTGQPIGPPMRHQDGVVHAEFSPDGTRVATSSDDDCAMIWDSATGRALVGPLRHGDDVPHAMFSPDGRLLLTVSSDGTARVWDVATGEPITPPLPHDGPAVFGAWSPDSREVATCSADATARVWDVAPADPPPGELQRQAELLSAHRLEPAIGSVPLSAAEMKARWEQMKRP